MKIYHHTIDNVRAPVQPILFMLRQTVQNFHRCKLQTIIKIQKKLCNNFRFLTLGVVYKFQCGLCNELYHEECVRYIPVRSGEHIGISPSTNKKV